MHFEADSCEVRDITVEITVIQEDIIKHIDGIYSQVVASYAMPPGNITFIESSERQTLNSLYKKIKNL